MSINPIGSTYTIPRNLQAPLERIQRRTNLQRTLILKNVLPQAIQAAVLTSAGYIGFGETLFTIGLGSAATLAIATRWIRWGLHSIDRWLIGKRLAKEITRTEEAGIFSEARPILSQYIFSFDDLSFPKYLGTKPYDYLAKRGITAKIRESQAIDFNDSPPPQLTDISKTEEKTIPGANLIKLLQGSPSQKILALKSLIRGSSFGLHELLDEFAIKLASFLENTDNEIQIQSVEELTVKDKPLILQQLGLLIQGIEQRKLKEGISEAEDQKRQALCALQNEINALKDGTPFETIYRLYSNILILNQGIKMGTPYEIDGKTLISIEDIVTELEKNPTLYNPTMVKDAKQAFFELKKIVPKGAAPAATGTPEAASGGAPAAPKKAGGK